MLVLGRTKNQEVYIDIGEIRVKVLVTATRTGGVGLGFTAPPEVKINRREVVEAQESGSVLDVTL